ncbi:hypothetical protein P691DRAFT_717986 [Macrolepiota fuliginosa MF-IS2]|uniref:Pentatricopeptide repeat-containing protein n=1 Tax=Macrolepiota fuliginosa MF-IS2 TaxID=1400762 RepID=A0A9P5XNN9_9AGAR|nr:hypothetical protein P691DRAFT_717986 [Macrolepiota fuliginosa MF-IS2]
MSTCRSLLRLGRSLSRPNSCRIAPIVLHGRSLQYSTTTNPTASSSAPIEQDVEKLTSTTSLHAIHTHYTNLVAKLKESEKLGSFPTRKILSETQLYKILWLLARSGRPSDIQRLNDILLDMPLVLGLSPTVDTHTVIIKGFIRRGDIHATRRWIEGMPKRPGQLTPTLEHYHLFLQALPEMEECSFKFMRGLVNNMRPTGCKPTMETFRLLLLARWKLHDQGGSRVRPISLAAMFEDMEKEGLPYDPIFSELLYDEYAKRDLSLYAEQTQSMYQAKFSAQDSKRPGLGEMDSKIMQTAQSKGIRSAIALYRSWKPTKLPSPANIHSMLRHSHRLPDLHLIEQEFNVKCDVVHWSLLILNNVRADKLEEALPIYEASKAAGITPDAAMVSPLIHSLCRSNFGPPLEAKIDQALQIYVDLRAAVPPEEAGNSQRQNFLEHSIGPDQDIYATLLRGIATARLIYRYKDVAKEIMDDMASRNYTPDDSSTVSSIIVLHMRHSSSIDEALEVYRRLKPSLDEKGYAVVLSAFCKLRFGDSVQIPSIRGYFEMVKDMRLAGLNITVEVYTILLHQLGLIATQIQRASPSGINEFREKLILTTRRTHDLLTLDASLSPDAILWNQMMDTYQRLGCFADAYRVWEMMYLSSQFDSTSVSIIFDACGYAGAYSVARRIMTRLVRDNYQYTSHNWNTWLECLCRLGRLDEAVGVLCGEGEGLPEGARSDVESVKLVFKFAKGERKEREVMCRVQESLPDLWVALPESIRGVF